MWHPYDAQTYELWLDAIVDEASDQLNDWESKFINDMQNQLRFNSNFTRNQSDMIEKIYTKYTK
jgi:hypothetical protein